MKTELTESESKDELLKRFVERIKYVTAEAIAAGHSFQLAVMTCIFSNLILMCSRRAGKTRALCGLLLLTAIKTPNCSSLYLALTKGQAEKVWRKHWLPMLRKFKLYALCNVNETDQMVTFPNGATVVFGGTNNLRTITHLLGDSMAGGIAVLDEQQDDPGVLEDCAVNIIGPMVQETTTEIPIAGRMVIAGTVPNDPIGYFWELWTENFDEEKGEHKPDAQWHCFAWSRYDNPHEKDNEWHEEVYCKKFKLYHDDPIVLRNFRGIRTWDTQSKCFGYRIEINRWNGRDAIFSRPDLFPRFPAFRFVIPPGGIDLLWIGIDPAQAVHRFAIEAFGTCSKKDMGAWHVGEAVTDPGGDPTETEWLEVVKFLKLQYGNIGIRLTRVFRDPGSNQETNDVLLRSHQILIEPAIKGPGSLKGRVERVRDMNMQGILHTLEGSQLEEDFIKAAWDKTARAKGKWEFDSKCHPDAGDAATYILPAWTAVRLPPDPYAEMSEEEREIAEVQAAFLKRYTQPERGKTRRERRPAPWSKPGF